MNEAAGDIEDSLVGEGGGGVGPAGREGGGDGFAQHLMSYFRHK